MSDVSTRVFVVFVCECVSVCVFAGHIRVC